MQVVGEGGVRRGPKEKQCSEVVKTILVTPSNVFFEHLSSAASVMAESVRFEISVKLARQNENQVQTVKVPLGPIATVFTEEEEKELVEYLKEMEGRLFGLTTSELKKLAYELAVRNNKQNKFNEEKGQAGKDWIQGFLRRHRDLSLRKSENTSATRAAGFNRVSVGRFFES
ncbi:hypothetical protein ILUMI_13269 [Ignelater luminosus]|uniref:HTH CENPB-type domain-containing protein n=1 Tax=Ignelater luminosus TaxID=2038154 RepID=A0A8K0GB21_IGNLU|nr:hypothetical protein ILUMI_13269 [Ignelater luminosus]